VTENVREGPTLLMLALGATCAVPRICLSVSCWLRFVVPLDSEASTMLHVTRAAGASE
jgi:hypothetical protein